MITTINEYQCGGGHGPIIVPCKESDIDTDIGLTEIMPSSEENEECQKTPVAH